MTVSDICTAADIAPRTFHRYFTSKEDVVNEPVRRMGRVVADAIAAAPATADDTRAITGALLDLGRFAIANHEWLAALRLVLGRSQQLRASTLALRPEQERDIADLLAARHPGGPDPDWRLRLLVAVATAAFRIWFEDYTRDALDDAMAHLEEVLRVAIG